MKISVVITVYNLEHFVAGAIESVLRQTHPAHEIFVVDDGSKDNSVSVIERYSDRVTLVRMEQNSGVLPAFLAGVRRCTGEVLAFLDGDDLWMDDKLEKINRVFTEDPQAMMVTHGHQWIDGNGRVTGEEDDTHRNIRRVVSQARDENEQDQLLKNSLLCYKGVWLGSAFCIRRSDLRLEAYESWVYSLPDAHLSHQDQPLAAWLVHDQPHKRIRLINEPLFQYRVYPTNSSGSSVDVQSAIRTINRSIATVSRTYDLVRRHPEWKEENRRQHLRLVQLEYYRDLYLGRRVRAVSSYLRLQMGFWKGSERQKETQRLMACLVLGPSRFLQLKTRKRFQTA